MKSRDWENQLNPEERRALTQLDEDVVCPPDLENQVVSALRRQGLLASPAARWIGMARIGGMAAALLITFALGAHYGKQQVAQDEAVADPEVEVAPAAPRLTGSQLATAFHEDVVSEYTLLAQDATGADLDADGLLSKPFRP